MENFDNEKIIREELESIQADLIQKHLELGMKASGKFQESLEVTTSENYGKLEGASHFYYMVYGRRNGGFPPIKVIEQWILDKGIRPIEEDMKISTLAFLIARKIAREGTEIHKQGGSDLLFSVVTPQRIQKILDRIKVINVEEFTHQVQASLTLLAV